MFIRGAVVDEVDRIGELGSPRGVTDTDWTLNSSQWCITNVNEYMKVLTYQKIEFSGVKWKVSGFPLGVGYLRAIQVRFELERS